MATDFKLDIMEKGRLFLATSTIKGKTFARFNLKTDLLAQCGMKDTIIGA